MLVYVCFLFKKSSFLYKFKVIGIDIIVLSVVSLTEISGWYDQYFIV